MIQVGLVPHVFTAKTYVELRKNTYDACFLFSSLLVPWIYFARRHLLQAGLDPPVSR